MTRRAQGRAEWRLWTVALVLGIATAGLTSRLAYLQIVEHPTYSEEARGEHVGTKPLVAHRGAILDRNGYPLATSVDTWDISLDRKAWTDGRGDTTDLQKLAELLGTSAGDLTALIGSETTGTLSLARQIEYEAGRKMSSLGIPGLILDQTSRRAYPEGDSGAPLLGFIGRDGDGLTGVEADFNSLLNGTPGRLWYERDSLGNPIAFGYRYQQDPAPGHDVVLTIDRAIQRMAERELDAAIARTGAKGGSVIVQDPKTGAILAMASRPSFSRQTLDLNNPKQMELLRNRAVTDQYEPGSVFKLLTMAAAIDSGKVTPNTTYMDTGQALVGERIFKNWDYSANGVTPMTTVLVRSLNTGTVWLADKIIGAEAFYRYVKAFGFGQSTGIGLEGEAPGMYRVPTDEGWYRADLASNSFGQGITATPLQMINMVTAIANGGTLLKPYMVKEVRGGDGVQVTASEPIRRPISEATARTMREMMGAVLDANIFAVVPGYSAGGKSGTAFVPTVSTGTRGDAYVEEVTIPSYAGFAPLNDPKVSILVKLDNLGTSDFGGTLTAPVFARLARDILMYMRVPPDRPETLGQQVLTPPTPAPAPPAGR